MKILINQLGRIGDLILITPIFKILKENFTNAEIYLIAGNKNYVAVSDDIHLTKTFVYFKTLKGITRLLSELRKEEFDYYLDPKDHQSTESGLLSKIIKAKVKIGYTNPKAKFDVDINSIRGSQDIHFTDVALAGAKFILRQEKIATPTLTYTPSPNLFCNKNSDDYLSNFLSFNNISQYLVINISASNRGKMWLNNYWIEVIHFLQKNYLNDELKLVISFSPSEKQDAEQIVNVLSEQQHQSTTVFTFNSRSILDTYSLVCKSHLLLSPDTALIHIASAFNTPIIALYSGDNFFFEKFKPSAIQSVAESSYILRAPKEEPAISNIKPEQVIISLQNFFQRKGSEVDESNLA